MKGKQIFWMIPLGFMALLITACGGNPGWDGHKTDNLTEQVAEEACKCIYKLMEADERLDVDQILTEIKDNKATKEAIVKGEILKKMPLTTGALMLEEEISMKLDESECMKPIEDKAFNAGIEFEEWMEVLDAHCLLGIFYN